MKSSIILAVTAFIAVGMAHVELIKPYPIRSKENPANKNVDYSMKMSLLTDGSNYPCKGYNSDEFVAVETYVAGETYEAKLEIGAHHNGGSGQFSLSYDNGETFYVIKSVEGGMPFGGQSGQPIKSTYSFKIPSDMPSSKHVLFAWTWINRIGNREFYQNCAFVEIRGNLKYRPHQRHSIPDLPELYICNIDAGPDPTCTTVPDTRVCIPHPGKVIEYGRDRRTDDPLVEITDEECDSHKHKSASNSFPMAGDGGRVEYIFNIFTNGKRD